MKNSILILILYLALFSCNTQQADPFEFVGRYSLCQQIDCENAIQVNNRSTTPGANTGVVLRFESGQSLDTICHYQILGNTYHITQWDSINNGSYSITHKDHVSFHLSRMDGHKIYFEKYKD